VGVSPQEYPDSPVPSDRSRWPGEAPCRHWGQFGPEHLDLRVFDQGIWWVDRYGRPHLLAQMSDECRANLFAHLEENCRYFHFGPMRRRLIQMIGNAHFGRV